MQVLLIVNPSASGVTPRGRVLIQNAIAAQHHLDVVETNRRGHATRHAQGAVARGIDLVVSLGGDGTLNEVANGLARSPVRLGVLPGGSTNVFARSLGLVNEPVEATTQLLDAVARDNTQRIGLGNVNGRFFCFHVGMGYDAAVVARVERHGQMKRWLGHPLFLYAAVATWARGYDRSTPPFRIELGEVDKNVGLSGLVTRAKRRLRKRDGTADMEGFFAIALNTDPYTYLGPRALSLVPEATLERPLALVNLRTLRLGSTLQAVVAGLRGGGRLGQLPGVDVHTDLQAFIVRGNRPFPWQVDGDHLGDAEVLEFRYEPAVLTLVIP